MTEEKESANSKANSGKNIQRRRFLKASVLGIGGLGLGGAAANNAFGQGNQGNNNGQGKRVGQPGHSGVDPHKLEITDLRYTVLDGIPFPSPIIRIETNDDNIYGLGEMRDHGDPRHALMLKSLILGKNPLNIEEIFREIQRYGSHARAGGGVSAIDMALHDIAGKYYGMPAHQLIGGQYREKVRLYSDTAEATDPIETGERLNKKIEEGYTFLKVDVGADQVRDIAELMPEYNRDEVLVNAKQWENENGDLSQYGYGRDPDGVTGPTYGSAEQPFTRIQLTETGLDVLEEYMKTVRDIIGNEVPLGTDHMGHFPVTEQIELAERWKKFDLAYMENVVPWYYTDQWKEFSDNTTVPSMAGESIYGLDPTPYMNGDPDHGFKALIDERAVDMIHPDPATAGGISETKKIADYAHDAGIPMFLHFAGSPVGAMASAHIAAASRNFVALENHSAEVDDWENLIVRTGNEEGENIFTDGYGYYEVPEAPGLGVELNEDVAKDYVADGEEWFAETEEWDDMETRQFWE